MTDSVTLGFRTVSLVREAFRLHGLSQDYSKRTDRSYLGLAALASQTLLLGVMAIEMALLTRGGSKGALIKCLFAQSWLAYPHDFAVIKRSDKYCTLLEVCIKIFKCPAFYFSADILLHEKFLGLNSSAWNKAGRILTILDAATLFLPKTK